MRQDNSLRAGKTNFDSRKETEIADTDLRVLTIYLVVKASRQWVRIPQIAVFKTLEHHKILFTVQEEME
jgi:hypothetical protein